MLQNTSQFREDIARYTAAIDRISHEQEKLSAKKLLTDLVHQVKHLDDVHTEMIYSKQMASTGNELKSNISTIRKNLDLKLKKAI